MKKEWRDVVGYEGLYKVSNYGEVYSVKRGRCLNPFNKSGYLYVQLYKNTQMKNIAVHRLVMFSFTDPLKWKEIVNHLDFNKHNNNIKNLEWVTNSENIKHRLKHYGCSKLIGIKKANSIRRFYNTIIINELELSKIYNVNKTTIHNIVQNKTYYDKNYIPPNRKFKNGYSNEFIRNMKDMYYIYNIPFIKISKLFELNYNYVFGAIKDYHKHLDL